MSGRVSAGNSRSLSLRSLVSPFFNPIDGRLWLTFLMEVQQFQTGSLSCHSQACSVRATGHNHHLFLLSFLLLLLLLLLPPYLVVDTQHTHRQDDEKDIKCSAFARDTLFVPASRSSGTRFSSSSSSGSSTSRGWLCRSSTCSSGYCLYYRHVCVSSVCAYVAYPVSVCIARP